MSDFTANVRVIPDDPAQRKPAPEKVLAAADRLDKLGFTVVRVGRFGVSVTAPEEQFVDVLGCKPLSQDTPSMAISPSDPQLKGLVDAVEMPFAPHMPA